MTRLTRNGLLHSSATVHGVPSSALQQALHASNYRSERGQRFPRTICFTLLEIIAGLPHGVGDMGEAQHSGPGGDAAVIAGCPFLG